VAQSWRREIPRVELRAVVRRRSDDLVAAGVSWGSHKNALRLGAGHRAAAGLYVQTERQNNGVMPLDARLVS